VLNQIRGTGNNLALSDLTTDPATGTVRLFGRPVISSDYAPAFTGTTGTANYAVVGDIGQGYTVAVRAGLTVEVVQEGFDQATFRPTMQRGLLAYARFGANVSVPNSIRLLSNT